MNKLERDPNKVFTNKQLIRHAIKSKDKQSGSTIIFSFIKNEDISYFSFMNKEYKSLYKLTTEHYAIFRPDRTDQNNSWKECETFVDDKWISIFDLQPIECDGLEDAWENIPY